MKNTVCVIGGGASGIMASIAAAQAGAKVILLEHSDRIGKKILLTGNGKCNLTNLHMDISHYRTSGDKSLVETVLNTFSEKDLMAFMQKQGMRLMINRKSYVYPECEAAATVVNVLRRALDTLDVSIYTNIKIKDIVHASHKYCIETEDKTFYADRVVMACGGKSYPKTGSDGSGYTLLKKLNIPMVRPYPALTALISDKKGIKTVSGMRANAMVTLLINAKAVTSDYGQVQFTDYGISGIPVFQVSTDASLALQAGKKVAVRVNLFPDMSEKEVFTAVKNQLTLFEALPVEDALQGFIHKKWIEYLNNKFKLRHFICAKDITEDVIDNIVNELVNMEYNITAVKEYDFCQVTGGGAALDQIDDRMQAKAYPGLYIVGELLDVTGECGGYNLQWAFSTGYIAGSHAAI